MVSRCFISGLSLKKSLSSSNSFMSLFKQFPYKATVSKSEVSLTWSALLSLQNCLKRRSHLALVLVALIHFINEFSIGLCSASIFLPLSFLCE